MLAPEDYLEELDNNFIMNLKGVISEDVNKIRVAQQRIHSRNPMNTVLHFRAGIFQSVYRWTKGWAAGVLPGRDKRFSPVHSIQTGSGTHPASYPMDTCGSFPGSKAAGA
jgi:hypothetical protein